MDLTRDPAEHQITLPTLTQVTTQPQEISDSEERPLLGERGEAFEAEKNDDDIISHEVEDPTPKVLEEEGEKRSKEEQRSREAC